MGNPITDAKTRLYDIIRRRTWSSREVADLQNAVIAVETAVRADERADVADQLAQALQALLCESDNVCTRLRQLGVKDDDIDASASAIERAVKRADAIVRGKAE
jgi:hypothetical protein